MVDVRMPDGVVVRFPDSMSRDQIKGMIATKFPDAAQPKAPAAAPVAPKADVPADDPYDLKKLPKQGALGSSVEGLMQGLTFGFGDEITAGALTIPEMIIGAATGKDSGGLGERAATAYDRSLTRQRAMIEQAQQDHPIASTVGEVAGAATSGGKLAASGLTLTGRVAGGLLPRTLAAGAEGAGYAGAYGFGTGEGGFENRVEKAYEDGKVGAGFGAAFPAAAAAASGLIRAGKQIVSPATSAIHSRLAPQDKAARLVSKAFTRDGVPIDDAASRIGTMQRNAPDAVLADVGGANVRGKVRAAVNVPGAGRQAILEEVDARNLAQPDRISEALKGNLADPAKFGQTVDRMAAQRERIASPIYQKAFGSKAPVDITGVVKHIDDTVSPGVNQLVSPMSDLRPDSTTALLGKMRGFFATAQNQRVDLKALHSVKMEIDGMIGVAKRSGDDTKARALLGVQRRLLRAMDSASPDYRKARGIYSSTYEMEDALEVGKGVFRMQADAVRSTLSGMTPAEREMVQLGAARAIQERIASQRDGRDVVKAVFGTPAIRDTMRAMFQDEQAFRKFRAVLSREAMMRRTGDAAKGNSTTASQLGEDADLKAGAVGRDVFELLLEGHPWRAAAAAVRQAIKGEEGITEAVADKMAEMLLSKDPVKIRNAVNLLKRKEKALTRIRDALRKFDPILTSGGGVAVSSPSNNQPVAVGR